MKNPNWLADLFEAIDKKDSNAFESFLSRDCVFRFGNEPPVEGAQGTKAFVEWFFESIDSLSHDILETWDTPAGKVCHGFVSYTRLNGSTLTVPFCNIFKHDGVGITDYLIFADTSQLYG